MKKIEDLETMLLSDALKYWHMKKSLFYEKLKDGSINPRMTLTENGKRTIMISEVIRVKEKQILDNSF